VESGVQSIIHRLLDPPGGLHFSDIWIWGPDSEAGLTADLVSRCSDTLIFLYIEYSFHRAFRSASVVR
jgi:hypothetical protein